MRTFKNQMQAFAIKQLLKYVERDPEVNAAKALKIIRKIDLDGTYGSSWDELEKCLQDPGNNWTRLVKKAYTEWDPHVRKKLFESLICNAAIIGNSAVKETSKKYGVHVPWTILMDPTSACNMHCTGCWAAEYGHRMSLSYEDLDSIVTQGEKLGIYFYMMTGGEPLMRKKDIVKLAEKHNKCMFYAFTNGTLIDEEFCKDMQRLGNISLALSVEGFEEVNDSRRGSGCFEKVMHAMDLLKEHGLIFGTSICYTSKNYKTVTSDEFLDMLIDKGVRYAWYFHYMPVGNEAATDLLLTPEQREYMYHRIREIRGIEGGKPIFVFDFQNDGEFVGGCIAGGRFYCHINPNGDVEPCVFIHYSNANIHDKPRLECLSQPLVRAYQMGQPVNENDLRPCPMLENPEALQKIVHATDAKRTDMQSPETVESLCVKCEAYAKCWAPEAEKLKEANPKQITREKGTLPEV